MSDFTDAYVKAFTDKWSLFNIMGWQLTWAIFNDMPSSMPIADWLSACHNAETYMAPQDKFGGGPSCSVCRRVCQVHLVARPPGGPKS